MPTVQIHCKTCGSRLDSNLNEEDIRNLQAGNALTRYCRRCAGNTRWTARGIAAVARMGRLDDEEAQEKEAPKKRVLLIDDDESILAVLGKVLKSMELELEVASTGREAAQMFGRNDYDLVLSDIRMPELDGKQLFEFLDQNFPEYRQRLIFLTGDTGNPETMEFLQRTNCPYLTKPVEIPVLLSLLHHFFSGE